jgi:hypothetical protein
MRVVLDTNTLVSAVLSPTGPPRWMLDAARARLYDLYSSPVLLAELRDVLSSLIVSGDKHLTGLGAEYQGIRIVRAAQAIHIIEHDDIYQK